MPMEALKAFLRLESAGGILLVLAAALALLLANSPLAAAYDGLLALPVSIAVGGLALAKPLLLWINDGLMAVFFLLVGLEIKREVLEGELSHREQIVLPAAAALGGFAVPAVIYVALNRGDISALNGWAIPTATDIAFALGVLSLLGPRVPLGLKLFLTTIAILDDLLAILVIALFYSGDLSVRALSLALVGFGILVALNRSGVLRTAAYLGVGVLIWVSVLKSGVHATLAGVLVAVVMPLRGRAATPGPGAALEEALHPWVAFGILPLFAFANAGVSLAGFGPADLFSGIPLGILLGLFLGKQIGVFGTTWLAVRLGLARKPSGTGWLALYGTSVLTGIGFTMSLFIGTLAFGHGDFDYAAAVRAGVLAASCLSALLGYAVLRFSLPDLERTTGDPNINPGHS